MSRTQDFFTISDLAREFGITPRTIRYYEDQGLLQKELSELSDIPLDTLKGRLNAPEDKGRWKACEIVKICKVLHIPQEQIGAYFFPAIAKEEKTA